MNQNGNVAGRHVEAKIFSHYPMGIKEQEPHVLLKADSVNQKSHFVSVPLARSWFASGRKRKERRTADVRN
jgi:hypothetical protein